MLDFYRFDNGGETRETDVFKAENLLSTNLGVLYYLPLFGISMDLFFDQNFNIQFESFSAYITDTMVNFGIDIVSTQKEIDTFISALIMNIGDTQNAV